MAISCTKPRRNSFRSSRVPFLQDLAESREVGQRVSRGGLNVDGLVVDALEVREARFELLSADADPPQALIHEVPVGGRGDVEEAIGLGLVGGELRFEL